MPKSSRTGIQKDVHPAISDIATAARAARQRHRLTQAQLAGLSGTGLRFISELERGKPTLALNKVLAVLSALGLQLKVSAGGQA